MMRLPIYCAAVFGVTLGSSADAALPPGTRGWQTVPNVIRADGVDSFVLEVETNGPVASVALDVAPFHFVVSGGQQVQSLRANLRTYADRLRVQSEINRGGATVAIAANRQMPGAQYRCQSSRSHISWSINPKKGLLCVRRGPNSLVIGSEWLTIWRMQKNSRRDNSTTQK
jgi:hypothetical protein